MYAGNIVEGASKDELFHAPLHPYTQGLMSAVPKLTGGGVAEGIPGRIPEYISPPSGCRFHPRCAQAMSRCAEECPQFVTIHPSHQVSCFLHSGETHA